MHYLTGDFSLSSSLKYSAKPNIIMQTALVFPTENFFTISESSNTHLKSSLMSEHELADQCGLTILKAHLISSLVTVSLIKNGLSWATAFFSCCSPCCSGESGIRSSCTWSGCSVFVLATTKESIDAV